MSMRDYAVDDYGLVLDMNHLHYLSEKLLDDFTEVGWRTDKYGYIESVADTLGIEGISEFSGEAFIIKDDGESDWTNTDVYSGNTIYYIGTSKYPNLFKQAYQNITELIDEFKKKIGDYLPKEFDYRGSIRHIVGTYFG